MVNSSYTASFNAQSTLNNLFAVKGNNGSDYDVAAFRTNLGLGGAALLNVGTGGGTVAAGNDSRFAAALQKSANLSDIVDRSQARTNLDLGALATLSTIADAQFTGQLSLAHGGTGATDAAGARSAIGLGNVENKSSATIRGELTKANVDGVFGKSVARVNAGTGTNSGLISWGTAEPGGTPDDGQIYLQYDA